MTKKRLAIMAVTWLVILVAGVSVTATLSICGALQGNIGVASSENYVVTAEQYEMIQRYEKLDQVYQLMMTEYVTELDEETLLIGAAQGMLAGADDPYTYFYTQEDMAEMLEQDDGHYKGIGLQVTITEEGLLRVTRVFKDAPAMKAGIRAGDYVTQINGETVYATNMKELEAAVAMIKEDEDGLVTLTLMRDGEEYTVTVELAVVNQNRVEYTMLDDGVGYIMLYEFQGDAATGFAEAVEALKKQGMRKLVVDLRSNPGGSLGIVLKIADILLPNGMILDIVDRSGRSSAYYSDAECLDMPLAILINENSASASEVLAGAVKDHGVGIIVGKTSFGKGIVQQIYEFEDGSGMQQTIARYYTPSGSYIHGVGITPDVEVELEGSFDPGITGPQPEQDAQLQAALDALKD